MWFSRQEYWSRSPFSSPGDLPTQRLNSCLPCLLHWQVESLLPSHWWSPVYSLVFIVFHKIYLEYVLSAERVSVWGCVLKDIMVTESGVVPSPCGSDQAWICSKYTTWGFYLGCLTGRERCLTRFLFSLESEMSQLKLVAGWRPPGSPLGCWRGPAQLPWASEAVLGQPVSK